MQNKLSSMSDSKVIENLRGIRLRIYCYLLQQDEPVGVRQTQRALHLKSPSHASYHLQKLLDDEIVEKSPQNSYFLVNRYKVKSIKINVLSDYFLLAGRFWPRTAFYAIYLIVSMVISLVLLITSIETVLVYYLSLSLLVSVIIAIYEVYKQTNALPWEE